MTQQQILSPASDYEAVRAAIRSLNPSIAIYGVDAMDEVVRQQTAPWRFMTWMIGIFAGLALCLCALGIYGVISYVVTQRTREFGIRIAIGAQPREVLRAVVGGGVRLMVIGMIVGGLAAVGLTRVVSSYLPGVSIVDIAPEEWSGGAFHLE